MHELSIVFYIRDQVKDIAKENNVKRVNSITLEIGEVSMVIPEQLEDCWKWICTKEEVLTDCKLKYDIIKAISYCKDCDKQFPTVENGKTCPYCGGTHTYLLANEYKDVKIKEIEVTA